MNLGDIFITYLEYEDVPNGKSRPVLYIEQDDEFYYVFKITSKYQSKSKSIRAKYAKITDRSEERRVGKECRTRWSADH